MILAHITDTHVRPRGLPAYRVVETNMLVERAVEALRALEPRPAALIVSGDLTDNGLVAEYEELARLLGRTGLPAYVVPGNHDRRENLKAVLAGFPGVSDDPDFVQFVVDDHPVRLVFLDTVVPGAGHGELCDRRLAFLSDALARRPDQPTIVVMHHPPFRCGIAHMDAIRLLAGEEAFRRIIAGNPQVERILCGHHHRPIHLRYAGTVATCSPGVAHQVVLDLTAEGAAFFVMEPATFQLHQWIEGTGLVTHGGYVERSPGPYPFLRDPDYPGA